MKMGKKSFQKRREQYIKQNLKEKIFFYQKPEGIPVSNYLLGTSKACYTKLNNETNYDSKLQSIITEVIREGYTRTQVINMFDTITTKTSQPNIQNLPNHSSLNYNQVLTLSLIHI